MVDRASKAAIQLRFRGIAASAKTLGPAPFYKVDGHFIREGEEATIRARYENHHWEVDGSFFSTYEVEGPTLVQFEDPFGDRSRPAGPFENLRFADGVGYAGDTMIARLNDETQLWHFFENDTHWPLLVLRAASSA